MKDTNRQVRAAIRCVSFATALLAAAGVASAQVQRTFVASYGADANTATNCGFANPCRSFAAAQTVTQSGGEIVAIDAAGYGAITINRSISILANPGVYAGISASTANAITISAPNAVVRLRGLKLNGLGAFRGVVMTVDGSLTVEDCTVTGFSLDGIHVDSNASVRIARTLFSGNGRDGLSMMGGKTDVVDSIAVGNGRAGFLLESDGPLASMAVTRSVASQNTSGFASQASTNGGSTRMIVSRSSADHNTWGFVSELGGAGGSAAIAVSSSRATRNTIGWRNVNATFASAGDNLVNDNDDGNVFGLVTSPGTM